MLRNTEVNNAKRKNFSGELLEIPNSRWGYLRQQIGDEPKPFIEGKSEQATSVQGKNLWDSSRINLTNTTRSGEVYTLKPNATTYDHLVMLSALSSHLSLKPDTLYTLTFVVSRNTLTVDLRLQDAPTSAWTDINESGNTASSLIAAGATGTFTLKRRTKADFTSVVYGLWLHHSQTGVAGQELDMKIMIAEGNVSGAFESFVPNSPSFKYPSQITSVPSSFNITSCGENLFDMSAYVSRTVNGVNITYNSVDNTYILHGTVTAEIYFLSSFINVPIKKGNFYGIKVNHLSGVVTQTGGYCIAYFGASDKPNATNNWTGSALANGGSYWSEICNYNYITRFWFYIDANAIGTTFDNYTIQIQLTEGEIDSDFKNYLGTTTTIALKDADNNLHEPCSLKDGVRDEVDFESGKIIKRIRTKVFSVSNANYSQPSNESNPVCYAQLLDWGNPWGGSQGQITADRFMCDVATSSSVWLNPGTAAIQHTTSYTQCNIFMLKTDLTDNGFTLDTAGMRAYLQSILGEEGTITFQYEVTDLEKENNIFDLHPDELAKLKQITTVDSAVGNIFTNAIVQPTISANAISC